MTDERGRFVVDWIGKNRLEFMKDGSYTHKRKKEEVLDLSLVSIDHCNVVKEWSTHEIPTNRFKFGKRIEFSDHRAMVMTLNLDPKLNSVPDRFTWNFDEKKVNEYKVLLIEKMIRWKKFYDNLKDNSDNVDKLVKCFQLMIVDAAKNSFGFKKYNSKSVNWVCKNYHRILKEKKKVNNFISHLIGKIKYRYNDIRYAPRNQKKLLKQKKQKEHRLQRKLDKLKGKNILESTKNIEKLINNPNVKNDKLMYDMVNKISKRNVSIILPIKHPKSHEIIATTNAEIAEEVHKHFIRPLTRNEYDDKHIRFHNHIEYVIDNYEKNNNKSNSIVNRPYSRQEVLKVINNLNTNSAMAFDLVHYKLIDYGKMILVNNMTRLFNLCFNQHQKCPSIWKYSEYVPLPKPGRDHSYCKIFVQYQFCQQ